MSESKNDVGQAEVQAKTDKLEAQGFFGVTTDPTPDENYTNRGVGKGLPTPETDFDQAEKVRLHQADVSKGLTPK